MEKWLGYQFSTGISPGEDYKKFQAAAKRALKQLANNNGFDIHSFNGNHYCFSAVLKHQENGRHIYVSISDVRYFPDQWYTHVLIRTMSHEKDWTGGHNNYCEWPDIGSMAQRLVSRN